ncbi:hypothetical protein EYF80_052824 [Liparis tanakae]|uniref:Uncharacterized protein n=1 Tax=Liparis tanakae TaxID=230148 RepID=A0A4Z2F7N2_9TELE|nr:hypothetical protein EYF80_052824 [Liparis tanakae]
MAEPRPPGPNPLTPTSSRSSGEESRRRPEGGQKEARRRPEGGQTVTEGTPSSCLPRSNVLREECDHRHGAGGRRASAYSLALGGGAAPGGVGSRCASHERRPR